MRIEISFDTPEVEAFVEFLRAHGHDASVINQTDDRVDGVSTYHDPYMRQIVNDLWEAYCNGS